MAQGVPVVVERLSENVAPHWLSCSAGTAWTRPVLGRLAQPRHEQVVALAELLQRVHERVERRQEPLLHRLRLVQEYTRDQLVVTRLAVVAHLGRRADQLTERLLQAAHHKKLPKEARELYPHRGDALAVAWA